MAEKTYYAWSPINNGGKMVKVGEKVSAGSLKIDEDDFNDLVESGAVRTKEYPVPEEAQGTTSPTQHVQNILANASESGEDLSKDEAKAVEAVNNVNG